MTDRRSPGGPRRDLDGVPDLADAPLDWDRTNRRFAPAGERLPDQHEPGGGGGRDVRRIRVPAPPEGGRAAPPPRRRPEVVLPDATAVAPNAEPAPTPAPAAASPARVVVPAPDGPRPGPRPATPASRTAPPATTPPPAQPRRRRRRRAIRILAAIAVVLVLAVAGGLLWGHQQFRSIDRVELADVLATGNGTNYLIVGSDTRRGISADDPNASAILGPGAMGGEPERSDTIMILRVDGEGSRMLSVPRDLLVTISETDQVSRINTAFNGGPRRLIATLRDQLQLPIHHYLEIDFAAFQDLVDAVGGITIDFPHPASDHMSGLDVMESGPVRIDGTQALAYVRSRYYTEHIDGQQVRDPTGDLGRVARQQQFLSAVVAEVGAERNPLRVARMGSAMADGMRIDDRMSYPDAIRMALRMRSMALEPTELPTSPRRTSSGMAVLDLVQPGADEVLARFGSTGATVG